MDLGLTKFDIFSSVASSKHLQTRRFLDTLKGYLYDMQRILIQLHRAANERSAPFVDHIGILRDSKTGRPIHGYGTESEGEEDGIPICTSPPPPHVVFFFFLLCVVR